MGGQPPERVVAVGCHDGLGAVNDGRDVAFAVVEIVVLLAGLAHGQKAADAAAQVQAPGVFTQQAVGGVALLDGELAVAHDAPVFDQGHVLVAPDPAQEIVVAVDELILVQDAVGIGVFDGTHAVLDIVGGRERSTVGGVAAGEVAVVVIGIEGRRVGGAGELVEGIVVVTHHLGSKTADGRRHADRFVADQILGVVLEIELGQQLLGGIAVGEVLQLVQAGVVVVGAAVAGPGQGARQGVHGLVAIGIGGAIDDDVFQPALVVVAIGARPSALGGDGLEAVQVVVDIGEGVVR